MAVGQCGDQALALRIVAASVGDAVHGEEKPLYGAAKTIILAKKNPTQCGSIGSAFDRRRRGVACFKGQIPDRFAEAEAVYQVQPNSTLERIDGHHLIVDFAVVHVADGEVDVVGLDAEGYDRSVIHHAASVQDAD